MTGFDSVVAKYLKEQNIKPLDQYIKGCRSFDDGKTWYSSEVVKSLDSVLFQF